MHILITNLRLRNFTSKFFKIDVKSVYKLTHLRLTMNLANFSINQVAHFKTPKAKDAMARSPNHNCLRMKESGELSSYTQRLHRKRCV